MIEPNWTLLFSTKPGRWWVRLLAWGRYHHVKAIAYLPTMRAWLFYDVKFNGTRLMLAPEDDPGAHAFLHDYLDGCDLIAMPRLPVPRRVAPHAGFWCTLAMKHLVSIRTAALRPDRLRRDSIAAGGKPYATDAREAARVVAAAATPPEEAQPSRSALGFLKGHAQTPSHITWWDDAALGGKRSELVDKLRARTQALREKAGTSGRGRPASAAASAGA